MSPSVHRTRRHVYVNVMSDTCLNVTRHSTRTRVTCFCVVFRKLLLFNNHIKYGATIILSSMLCYKSATKEFEGKTPIQLKILASFTWDDPETIFTSVWQQLASHQSTEHLWLYQRSQEMPRWTTRVKIEDLYQWLGQWVWWWWIARSAAKIGHTRERGCCSNYNYLCGWWNPFRFYKKNLLFMSISTITWYTRNLL